MAPATATTNDWYMNDTRTEQHVITFLDALAGLAQIICILLAPKAN
jgi:hypothetical protein